MSNAASQETVARPMQTQDDDASYVRREGSLLGNRPAEGAGSAPTRPQPFQHSFWDPQIAHIRAIYIKILAPTVVLMVIMMWFVLPVYWGSLGETSLHVPNLNGIVVNRDPNGQLGQALVQAFQANSRGEGGVGNLHLTWYTPDQSEYPTDQDVIHSVLDEKWWTAVVITPDVTAALNTARSSGNSSWSPQAAVTFYYNQGRNEQAANSFIVPLTEALLTQTLAKFNAQFTAQWLSSAPDATALTAAASAPQTISGAFGFTPVNLRPFTKTVSTAILLVGQIYITIFGFVVTMAHDAARGVIAPFLTFRSYAKLRIIAPMIAYIPLSFSYAMISLPFKVTFGEHFGYGGGFFIFWLYVYMGIGALGLSTEAMITILTPKFISYFLLVLIIFNVSVASVPIVLQPGFYRYGYGFPVFNLSQAVRTIIFNTKSHLGLNAGVLIAWIALNICTITIFTWFMRRPAVKAEQAKQIEEKDSERKA